MSIFRIVIETKICGKVRYVEQACGTGLYPILCIVVEA